MSKNFLLRQFLKVGGSFLASASIAIGALCPIVLNSSKALADSFQLGIPTEAVNALQSLDSQKINPKAIAFAPNGGWVILYGNNNYNAKNIPQKAVDTLKMLHDQDSRNVINSITFTPAGEWVIVYNNNGLYPSDNFPQVIYDQLLTLHNKKSTIQTIAFAPDGAWVIVYDKNGFTPSINFPKEANDKLLALNKQAATIQTVINTVAFSPNGGFAIIYNTTQYYLSQNNIPPNLSNAIEQYHKTPYSLVNIAFTPTNGCALLYQNVGLGLTNLNTPELLGPPVFTGIINNIHF
ncbi:MAG: hypothetical protein KME46_32590 [Brasilonema angustatum HA4187-MV1]|jgi:WD40 repeat protein|nr:hypothetical protein [Brasilonema angustatum HA4187-MV1]